MSKNKLKDHYIYINNFDEKIVINKDGTESIYNNFKITDKDFVFYDNQHIVGTDLKQSTNLKGMATINYFNNYTKFSQGIFRLRKLNKGHHIHFCMSKEIKNIISNEEINSIDILTFLLENEIKTLDSDYIIMLEQHLFNMIRKNENKDSFIINNFYNQYLNKEDLLDTNKPKLTFTNKNLCENKYKMELSTELQENYNYIYIYSHINFYW